jgi:hypothetical protein
LLYIHNSRSGIPLRGSLPQSLVAQQIPIPLAMHRRLSYWSNGTFAP